LSETRAVTTRKGRVGNQGKMQIGRKYNWPLKLEQKRALFPELSMGTVIFSYRLYIDWLK